MLGVCIYPLYPNSTHKITKLITFPQKGNTKNVIFRTEVSARYNFPRAYTLHLISLYMKLSINFVTLSPKADDGNVINYICEVPPYYIRLIAQHFSCEQYTLLCVKVIYRNISSIRHVLGGQFDKPNRLLWQPPTYIFVCLYHRHTTYDVCMSMFVPILVFVSCIIVGYKLPKTKT